jgi:hypothetical protein
MYARLSVLVCLLSVSASAGGSRITSGSEVELYLKSDGGGSPVVLGEMKTGLASLMYGAGLHVRWWSGKDRPSGIEGDLIVIDLRGNCEPPAPGAEIRTAKNTVALASSAIADGHVLPFSWVDCAAVNGFLSDLIAALPSPQREHVYGRALARLLAHELYHVMTQSADHTETGITKSQFTPVDLIGARLEFNGVILSKPRLLDRAAPAWQDIQELDSGK